MPIQNINMSFIDSVYVHFIVYLYVCKKFWEELIAHFPLMQHGPHRKKNASNNSPVVRIPEGKRTLGRPRRKWVDNIEIDIRD
jgi:hypothetical protein